MRKLISLFAVSATLLAASADARERVFEPSGDWQLRSAAEFCAVTRDFTDATGASIRLQLQSFGPAQSFKVTMVGDGLPLREGRRRGVAQLQFRFEPDPDWRRAPGMTGYRDGADMLTFAGSLHTNSEVQRLSKVAPDEPEPLFDFDRARAAEIIRLGLAYPSRDDTVLAIGPMIRPLGQIQDCGRTLVQKWGYPSSVLDRVRKAARLSNPKKMIAVLLRDMRRQKLGHNDAIYFRADIDEEGRVANCIIQHPALGSDVEAVVCAAVQETAEFDPALDADGNPVKSLYFSMLAFGVR